MIPGWDLILIGMNPYRTFLGEGFRTRSGHLLQGLLSMKKRGRIYYAYPEGGSKGLEKEGDGFYRVNLSCYSLSQLIKKEQLERVIYWLYHPLLLGAIPQGSGILLFDAVDNWGEHPAFSSCQEEVMASYEQLREQAQIIFTVSQERARFFHRPEGNVYWIPNAVPRHFLTTNPSPPQELKEIPSPLLGYVGVVQERFDVVLIERLAQDLDTGTILLVGPVMEKIKDLLAREKRIVFLGFRPYHEIPGIISSFQVGLIPHHVNALTQSMDPIKIYEYLALGCPVVSTPVAGAQAFSSVLTIASSHEEFIAGVKRAVKDPGSPAQRRKAVQGETWENRIKTMQEIIQNYMKHC